MSSLPEQLRARTKQCAIRIVRLFLSLPKNDEARIIGKQLLRAGTSVAANYRAVCRSRSRAEFVAKMGIVVEEADEAVFWLELLIDTGVMKRTQVDDLLREANELLAIFAASHGTARQHRGEKSPPQTLNGSMAR